MGHSLIRVYVHFVWATAQRQSLLGEAMRAAVLHCVAAEAAKLGCARCWRSAVWRTTSTRLAASPSDGSSPACPADEGRFVASGAESAGRGGVWVAGRIRGPQREPEPR